ncbi:MAG TPA: glucoamylase family protein [Anaerovoracaceae bacterium]|nr:glucoamylase family protein [Anaerovoracaceae bacterium]
MQKNRNILVNGASLSEEVLEDHARTIAREHSISLKYNTAGWPMLRMNDNYSTILSVCNSLNEDVAQKRTVPPAAEWLLDNFYIVEEQVKSIRRDLTKKEYYSLPILGKGRSKGYARILAIAMELVSHTDGQIEVGTLLKYLDAYQSHTVLLEREIRIIPIMIKLALVENVRRISEKIIEAQAQWNIADEIFENWMTEEDVDLKAINKLFKSSIKTMDEVNPSFIEHLFYRLRRSGRNYSGILKYIDENLDKYNTTTESIALKEHNVQAVYTVSMGNCIASLKYLSSFDWCEIFENISFLEKILRQDPEGVYGLMNIDSRNYYKNKVGMLAKAHRVSELHIAREAIELAKSAFAECREAREAGDADENQCSKRSHVGYYLVGRGLKQLESRQKGEKSDWERTKTWLSENLGKLYLGFITLLTVLIVAFVMDYAYWSPGGENTWLVVLAGAVVLIPASEVAVSIANWLVCKVKKPSFFPRLELKEGIPDSLCTMVVVPALLSDEKRVEQLLENMESHYLANREQNLYFALLGAFSDSAGPTKENDTSVLHTAADGIRRLNQKYAKDGKDLFYFYNRLRKFNECDNSWTGWERKRGALMEFNDMLLGSQETSIIFYSNGKLPATEIKYIITLDADTMLPFGMAKKMIGAMAHPLNTPVVDGHKGIVTEGYGVMQPRISFDIESANKSVFSRIYTGQEGIDPYSSAISDVYQDLFGEGIFTGKGIYELKTFQSVLKDAIPENAVLSHDLLEGSYARAALVTDLELVDSYPAKYSSWMARLHRWIRGDWQLIPWLRRRIYNRKKEQLKNPLSFISRWKIADNLRRSLLTPALLALLLLGMSVLPGSGNIWAGFAVFVLGLPLILNFLEELRRRLKYDRIKRYRPGFFGIKSSLFQFLLCVLFLPFHSLRMLDAIFVTLFRVCVSKKNMLEWVTSADVEKAQSGTLRSYWTSMGPSIVFGALIVFFASWLKPEGFIAASALFIAWGISPSIAYRISLDDSAEEEKLKKEDLEELRKITRRTWRYFEEFTNSKNNYLAPDNFQEDPPRGIAYRTSPTNIGLGLLASLTGRDMGYIGIKETVDSIARTVTTIEKMEKWNGHLYNWYDTRMLEPLHPLYVSTVDSGNFVCYLITLAEGLKGYSSRPLVDRVFVAGIRDTVRNGLEDGEALPGEFDCFDLMENDSEISLIQWNKTLIDLAGGRLTANIRKPVWKNKAERMGRMFKEEINVLTPWAALTVEMPEELLHGELAEETEKLLDLLATNVSLETVSETNKRILEQVDRLNKTTVKVKDGSFDKGFAWLNEVIGAVLESDRSCRAFAEKYSQLLERIESLAAAISFKPLYNEGRQLFAIGYNVEEKKLTNSYYDLLASEARQASYIAIARGEVPPKHWFMLGRLLTVVDRYQGLVSWSGTMFEYMMPLLLMKSYRNTLLDETYSFVVKGQEKYGKVRNMPWGVSESSFHSLDINLDYQYKAIGVPWLGLKRGLVEDAVTSPYSTFLALLVCPEEAYENIGYLKAEGLEGSYGFYEAADYTPERLGFQSKKVIIKSFMAHHEGMSLLALNNYLNGCIMQERFHAIPEIRAARLLLQEKVPVNILFTKDNKERISITKARIYRDKGAFRRFTAPDFELPKTHVLSNGNYSVMLTDKGTGYSRSKTADITRWREDPILDTYGMFFYIKNVTADQYWSAAYSPFNVLPDKYEVIFTPDKAVFKRADGDVETTLEVVVASDDNVEIRKLELKNNGQETCYIEVTSYYEVVLASRSSDLAHPAFSNLFIRTEYDHERRALLANRRPRGHDDKEMWIAEVPVIAGEIAEDVQYETDRMQFIGRGHTVCHPMILEREKPLSNTVGAVLDPVFSQRIKLKIDPEQSAQIAFVTVTAGSKETIMELIDKYDNMEACDSAFWLALTRSQVETKYLNIKAPEMELYQDMISNILYKSAQKSNYRDMIRENRKGQSSLWPYGISGDRPVILVELNKEDEVDILYEVLKAQEYWRLKDLKVDLVIMSHEENSYSNPLYTLISEIVQSSETYDALHRHNDIFIVNTNSLDPEDIPLFYAVARMIFKGGCGTMKEQVQSGPCPRTLVFPEAAKNSSNHLLNRNRRRRLQEQPEEEPAAAANEIRFFNGIGGFDNDGKEYVIRLEQGQITPAPWTNVIANPEFGFMVTEAGGGYTWCENSRENKLSPWANDPVSDNQGEIFYLKEGHGDPWSITPLPARDEEAYTVRHGFGYTEFEHECRGIKQRLTQFVPVKGTVKISIISLKNDSNEDRNLGITYYLTPVLGVNATENAMHIVTSLSGEGALLVENPYNREFPDRICFMDSSVEERTVTGDRGEFFGFGMMSSPDALKYKKLSGTVGAGLDPCAAMQANIRLKAGETREVVFLLGMADRQDKVHELTETYKDIGKARESLAEVKQFWQDMLQTVQVNTPDLSMNIMLNGWLVYQAVSCRMWARTAYYQAGGAFGFRDQLQDSLSVMAIRPEIAKNQIIRHARHQFLQGDVLHWWHEPAGKGTRTRFSDDYLWLPYVTAEYIGTTGDIELLNMEAPFLEDELLKKFEDERYCQPRVTKETASIYEHCIRSIEYGLRFGERGLPLMGGGDWNDGMNTVGNGGKGESVWLGWFLCATLQKFIPICRIMGEQERAERYLGVIDAVAEAIEKNAWDGNWYKRAFFDNGAPLGSVNNKECKIDSLAQSWAVISGKGDPARVKKALNSLEDYLVMRDAGLIKLLTPPFDEGELEPGYIKSYVPGVRENGGQYTHAAAWAIIAFAMTGDGDKACELFGLINPINHTRTDRECSIYKAEPYVVAADVYSVPPHVGRGGWTWYTGTASWFYKAGLESILGFTKDADHLVIEPCISKKWAEYSIQYRYHGTVYQITVKNPNSVNKGVASVTVDGERQTGNAVSLSDDGGTHLVEITMG